LTPGNRQRSDGLEQFQQVQTCLAALVALQQMTQCLLLFSPALHHLHPLRP
jgi:hypothetical protein